MDHVINCERCFCLTVRNGKTKLCQKCLKVDEIWLEIVLNFLRKRENRAATIVQVLEATSVSEDWIYDWIRQGKILQRHYPNVGIPCPSCGEHLTDGVTLCTGCKQKLAEDLVEIEREDEYKQDKRDTVYLVKNT